MGLMGVPASNLKRLGPTKEEEDMWKRAVYYSRLSQQTDNPKGADQIYNEARAAGRAGLPYQVTTPKGSKTYGQATYKKKSSPWSAALAADKNLAQQYRRRRGFMNKRRGTGGRISARHTTYMEARPRIQTYPSSPAQRVTGGYSPLRVDLEFVRRCTMTRRSLRERPTLQWRRQLVPRF